MSDTKLIVDERVQRLMESIGTDFKNVAKELNAPEDFLDMSVNTDKSVSLWLVEPISGRKGEMFLKFRLKGRVTKAEGDKKYFSFELPKYISNAVSMPDSAEVSDTTPNTTQLNFAPGVYDFDGLIDQIIRCAVGKYEPSDRFGCCSKYKECSQAKKCLHASPFYSKACWYRKNLEKGNIFY